MLPSKERARHCTYCVYGNFLKWSCSSIEAQYSLVSSRLTVNPRLVNLTLVGSKVNLLRQRGKKTGLRQSLVEPEVSLDPALEFDVHCSDLEVVEDDYNPKIDENSDSEEDRSRSKSKQNENLLCFRKIT